MRAAEPPRRILPLPRGKEEGGVATNPPTYPRHPPAPFRSLLSPLPPSSVSHSTLLPPEDVGDMAEAPGFNILHLKCSARARNAKQPDNQPFLSPVALLVPTQPPTHPAIHNDTLFQHGLDLKRANLSSTTRPTLTDSNVWSVWARTPHTDACTRSGEYAWLGVRVRMCVGHSGPHLNLKSALHNARPRRRARRRPRDRLIAGSFEPRVPSTPTAAAVLEKPAPSAAAPGSLPPL